MASERTVNQGTLKGYNRLANVWVFASVPFIREDGKLINAGYAQPNQPILTQPVAKFTGSLSSGDLIIATGALPVTENSLDRPTATLIAWLVDPARNIVIEEFSVFGKGFRVPDGDDAIDWDEIEANMIGTMPAFVGGDRSVGGNFSVGGNLGVDGVISGDGSGITDLLSAALPAVISDKNLLDCSIQSPSFLTGFTVPGTVQANNFIGNASGLTNIPGTPSGPSFSSISNAGSAWISGDTDESGDGVVDLITRNLTRLRVNNDGGLYAPLGKFGLGISAPTAFLHLDGSLLSGRVMRVKTTQPTLTGNYSFIYAHTPNAGTDPLNDHTMAWGFNVYGETAGRGGVFGQQEGHYRPYGDATADEWVEYHHNYIMYNGTIRRPYYWVADKNTGYTQMLILSDNLSFVQRDGTINYSVHDGSIQLENGTILRSYTNNSGMIQQLNAAGSAFAITHMLDSHDHIQLGHLGDPPLTAMSDRFWVVSFLSDPYGQGWTPRGRFDVRADGNEIAAVISAGPDGATGTANTLELRDLYNRTMAKFTPKARFWAEGGFDVSASSSWGLTPGYYFDGVKVLGAQSGAIADPTGGSVIDVQARAQLALLLAAARAHGWLAT